MNRISLLVVLAALGGGIAVGWFLRGEGAAAPDDDAVVLDRSTRPTPDAGRISLPETSNPELVGRPEFQPLRSALASFPRPRAERGEGVITGHVRIEGGAPLPGVQIRLSPRNSSMDRWRKIQNIEDPEERLLAQLALMVEQAREAEVNGRETLTDSEGGFRADGLTAQTYQVMAMLDGWQIHDSSGRAWQATAGTELEFVAKSVTGLELDIRGPDGKPAESANVRLHSQGGSTGNHWSPENRRLQVEPGSYRLEVTAGTYEEQHFDGPVTVGEASGAPVRVDLTGRSMLAVRSVFEGETVPGAVRIVAATDGKRPDDSAFMGQSHNPYAMHMLGRSSSRTTQAVEPGTYAVAFVRNGQQTPAVVELVTVGTGVTEHDLQVPALAPEEYVAVRALSSTGDPVQNVQFTIAHREAKNSGTSSGAVFRLSDGAHAIIWPQIDQAAEVRIIGRAQGLGTQLSPWTADRPRSLTLTYEAPVSLRVELSGLDAAVRDLVSITLKFEEDRHASGQQLGPDGTSLFAGLQPGEYTVSVSIRSNRGYSGSVLDETVRVTSDGQTVRLTMPRLYEVRFAGPANWSTHIRQKEGAFRNYLQLGSDGTGVMQALPAGRYSARLPTGEIEFDVPTSGPVDLGTAEPGRPAPGRRRR